MRTPAARRAEARRARAPVVVVAVMLAAGLLPAPVFAQERVVKEPDRTVFKKRTVIDFSEVAVEGELSRPEGSYSVSKRKTTFRSLVKVRDTLAPELQKSAENL